MQREGRKVSTFLSDEEEIDRNFIIKCSERSKFRRKTSRCISGIDDSANGEGVPPTNVSQQLECQLPRSEDTKECALDGSMALPEGVKACKESMRVVPGEVDSDWPEENLPPAPRPFCVTGIRVPSGGVHKRPSAHKLTIPSEIAPQPPQSSNTTPRLQSSNNNINMAANIQVACRFRPLISREVKAGDSECPVNFSADGSEQIGTGATVGLNGRTFTMDRVFAPSASQSEIYDAVARPIVQDVLEGYNGTVMAYGSTGSGKTYTMEGRVGDPELLGIIPRMVSTLFDGIDQAADTMEFTLKLSAVEIYMERIIDLLAQQQPDDADAVNTKVKVREDPLRGVWVDAVEKHAVNEADVFAVAHAAQASRRVAATHMNVRSSRSHYILMLRLTALDKTTLCERQGVLYLVDLAGSEKVSQTGAAGQTLEEAKKINRSLSCLGNVIVALTDEKTRHHVPYRDSKLTRVLQQSLGGNAKTALIATCSLATSCLDETLTTLRFGERAKSVCNTPRVNEQRSMEQLIRDLSDSSRTIEALQRDLASLRDQTALASPKRSIGTTVALFDLVEKTAADTTDGTTDFDLVVTEASKDLPATEATDDVFSELLAPKARNALAQMKHELNVMRRERDAAYEQLSQLRVRGVKAKRPPPGEEADCTPLGEDVGESLRSLEAECTALRFQVTSLSEAREKKTEEESKLKEEVLLLRDASVRSSQEVNFLQREREELRQLLQTCCSGDLEEERRQWNEMLGNEVTRREATCEQWRAYLSNRVHKVVQLEIEVDYLRDALASLQLSPHQLGLDITTFSDSKRLAGGDGDAHELIERLQQSWSEDSNAKPGRHANVAQPVVRRRLRQRSREPQLPKSPPCPQFSTEPELPQKPKSDMSVAPIWRQEFDLETTCF